MVEPTGIRHLTRTVNIRNKQPVDGGHHEISPARHKERAYLMSCQHWNLAVHLVDDTIAYDKERVGGSKKDIAFMIGCHRGDGEFLGVIRLFHHFSGIDGEQSLCGTNPYRALMVASSTPWLANGGGQRIVGLVNGMVGDNLVSAANNQPGARLGDKFIRF